MLATFKNLQPFTPYTGPSEWELFADRDPIRANVIEVKAFRAMADRIAELPARPPRDSLRVLLVECLSSVDPLAQVTAADAARDLVELAAACRVPDYVALLSAWDAVRRVEMRKEGAL